jgi:hypothetical protein
VDTSRQHHLRYQHTCCTLPLHHFWWVSHEIYEEQDSGNLLRYPLIVIKLCTVFTQPIAGSHAPRFFKLAGRQAFTLCPAPSHGFSGSLYQMNTDNGANGRSTPPNCATHVHSSPITAGIQPTACKHPPLRYSTCALVTLTAAR